MVVLMFVGIMSVILAGSCHVGQLCRYISEIFMIVVGGQLNVVLHGS
jgi:hypothetical protein